MPVGDNFRTFLTKPTTTPPPTNGNGHTHVDAGHPYLTAAIRGEAQRLSQVSQGSRNHALNIAALKLAQLPNIDRTVIRDHLLDACTDNG